MYIIANKFDINYNKHMLKEEKVRIYKTCILLILTYAGETRADTSKTKSMLRIIEIKILRNIAGCTLRDRIKNTNIREFCNVQDVVRWVRQRRRG